MVAINGARTHDWQASTDYESDVLPTAPRRPSLHYIKTYTKRNTYIVKWFLNLNFLIYTEHF